MSADVVIVGAGAAGLSAAIFARRLSPSIRVVLLEGARRPGAKILVSGGGRCNVTNARVTEHDFHGGSHAAIRQVLRALPVPATVAFFAEIGVPLHEEPLGKLFPDSNRSRDVLEALLREAATVGVERVDACRVASVRREVDGFALETSCGDVHARRVVLATGGQSLPKSGSDGAGWEFARVLGHTIVPPVPALVPLLLEAASGFPHARVSGVSHDAEVGVWIDGRLARRVRGSLLWTHFGVSGPAALDVSRHWTRASAEGRHVRLTLNVCPGETFETVDARLLNLAATRPRALMSTLLATFVPSVVAEALVVSAGVEADAAASGLTRDLRRKLAHALTATPLPVAGTRGFNFAEVTAGGVPLAEVDPRTMESRRCPGLFLAGEVLDVDGRLGGFNFQWAWASGRAAASGVVSAGSAGGPAGSDPGV